jgi:hypothetical protein
LAWADEPSALSVPPLGQLTVAAGVVEVVEVVEPPDVVDESPVGAFEPLELHAASATVPAAMSAAIEIRRFRPTGFSIRVSRLRVGVDVREAAGPAPYLGMNGR